jgi:single-strand DNA-binding protein
MNIVILVGNLTRDPEIRHAGNGTVVANINIAVNKAFKREGGPDADFFRITAFGKTAELAERYLSKGKKISVEGRIENNNYEKEGKTVYQDQIIANRIEFLSPKGDSGSGGNYSSDSYGDSSFGGGNSFGNIPAPAPTPAPSPQAATPLPPAGVPDGFSNIDDDDDDLPF